MGFGATWGHARRAHSARPTSRRARVPKERRGATIRRIAAFFRPYRWQVLVVLVAIFVTSLLGLVNPLLLKALIDNAIPSGSWQELNLFVALMIIVPIVSGLIGVGQSYWNNVVGQRVMQDLRNALYAHLQKMPLRFFAETRTGEIQSRLANDVGGVQSVVTDTASSVVSNVVIAVTTIIAMLFISWQLTVLSLVVLPFFMWLTYRVGKIRRSISTETQETLADVTADHPGDAQRERHPALQDVRPADRLGRALPGRQRQAGRAPDPPEHGRPLVLHDRGHDLQHHAGLRLLAGRRPHLHRRLERADDR